ncbi:hypothetical protein LIPSTDRAFT_115816 [Lipomyces starkeyi NRRL Y-11557]|uniref:Uncharacterized protein n=1 Tax=Lipomyces starkeyi NRRL Y-11557 TaxID=675824 RepID=A0A1E3QAM7_LIPST|nr:hypothetical protein LIPSTDRAFT_115816 [Lipomyces starkeyi NRRL Y-11557]
MQISFTVMRARVPEILHTIPIHKVRKFARYAWRFIEWFTRDLDGKAAIYAVKKYKSHRRLPSLLELE